MAYFKQKQAPEQPHEPVFRVPVQDTPEDDELYPEDPAWALTEEEEAEERRRGNYRVAAGIMDFLGVVAGAVVILLLVAMLISLINWVHADIVQSFDLWQTRM